MSTALIVIVSFLASCVSLSNCIVNRPPSVPANAKWLNNMPLGNEFHPPATPPQPVIEVNRLTCRPNSQGTCRLNVQVVEYLYAEVRNTSLGKGTATNQAIRDWVVSIGKSDDEAGHIVGKNEGGLGTVQWNIFPQKRLINRGVYRQVGQLVNDAAKASGLVRMWFRFKYGDTHYPCRPVSFDYYFLSNRFNLSDGLNN